MASKTNKAKVSAALVAEKSEEVLNAGILEGSPDGIGVVVMQLECGCRKMAAVAKNGETASKVNIYRNQAESICDKYKAENGDNMRVTEIFIHWVQPGSSEEGKAMNN